MYRGVPVYASEILKTPSILDGLEDPYVVVIDDQQFLSMDLEHKNMMHAINTLYVRGWETVNISFRQLVMVALLLNPRANRKNYVNPG